MKAFVWKSYFATGIAEVDEQHLYLVELVNKLALLFATNQLCLEDIEHVFAELKEYADYHFQEEERLMKKSRLDAASLAEHIAAHQNFLEEVLVLHDAMLAGNTAAAKHLLDFLSNWLVYHMLGMDQQMARQLKAIEQGTTAEQAFQSMDDAVDSATAALLTALNALFEQVSERNTELQRLNQTLEMKVLQRTQALQEANQRLEQLSMTDPLTDLPNRRYALAHLSKLWEEAQQQTRALSCLMIDADHFKQINDSFGHDAGDKVLIELMQLLKQNLRTDDVLCRLGGDEFLVICENTDFTGATHLAQLLCNAVAELKVVVGKGAWQGSVSIGVGSKEKQMQSMDELIKMADQGVYLAKEAGKNCVRMVC